jgi:hypothetical protein
MSPQNKVSVYHIFVHQRFFLAIYRLHLTQYSLGSENKDVWTDFVDRCLGKNVNFFSLLYKSKSVPLRHAGAKEERSTVPTHT